MLHDPVKYPDPESFQPERFLTPTGEFKDDPDIASAFGFGRRRVSCHDFVTRVVLNHKHSRVCPGRHLVDEIAYMFFSTFLSVFTVEKQKDEKGNEIPVNDKHNVEFSLRCGSISALTTVQSRFSHHNSPQPSSTIPVLNISAGRCCSALDSVNGG